MATFYVTTEARICFTYAVEAPDAEAAEAKLLGGIGNLRHRTDPGRDETILRVAQAVPDERSGLLQVAVGPYATGSYIFASVGEGF